MVIEVTSGVLATLRAEAERAAPEECCGLLLGCGEPALEPQPALLNLSAPLHYPLSAEQVQLQQQRIHLLRQRVQHHHQRQRLGVESLTDSIALEEQLALLEVSQFTLMVYYVKL